jgi:hypothetical protein
MKKKKTVKLAYVRWFDSSITHGETCMPEDAAGVLENESAGCIVREDKRSITLALDRCLKTEGLRCTLCIPKVNVRFVRRFSVCPSIRGG